MRDEYDFSKGRRGAAIVDPRKARITIWIDTVILEQFRRRAEKAGTGYQTMMNDALKNYLDAAEQPVTEKTLRNVLREEMAEYVKAAPPRKRTKPP